jgi:hypothetical protein
MKEKSRLIKEKTKKLIEASTSHGLPAFIRNEKPILKFVWLIAFLISSCVCYYFIAKSFVEYFRYETNSKIRIIKTENSIPFPVVSLCSLSFFQTDKINQELEHFLYKTSNETMQTKELFRHWTVQKIFYIESYREKFVGNTYLSDDEKQTYFYNESQFVFRCFFQGKKCPSKIADWYFDQMSGSCFRIDGRNLNFSYSQNESGQRFGLQLGLFAGLMDENNMFNHIGHHGISIGIYDAESTPILNDKMFNVNTGYSSNIRLKKIVTKSLPEPYSECVDARTYRSAQFHSEFVRYKRIYSKKICEQFCRQKKNLKLCNCSYSLFPRLENTKLCENAIDLKCASDNLAFYNVENDCDSCPVECEQTTYEYQISGNNYPTKGVYHDYLKEIAAIKEHLKHTNMTYEMLKTSLAYVNIYFDDLEYTLIEETPAREVFDLVSNVGG